MSAAMTERERWLATVEFQELDRPVRFEAIGIDDETVANWRRGGWEPETPMLDFIGEFGMARSAPVFIGAHLHPGFFPEFREEVLEDDGRRQLVRSQAGALFERFSDGSMSIPRFISFPVRNQDDFRGLLPRLNPRDHGRVDAWSWAFGLAQQNHWPLNVYVSGCFGFHRHLMGFENGLIAYLEDPELIHALSRAWRDLVVGVVERARVHGVVDTVYFWEDMCYKNGPMISPRMFQEFILPYYHVVCDRARELGARVLAVDTDGDCTRLVPLFVEAGTNLMLPFEVQAGMEVRKVRPEFPRLAIHGGLDKRVLAGTRDDIDRELEAKLPFMLAAGGYIPAIDHVVPPNVPLENWRYFLERTRGFGRSPG